MYQKGTGQPQTVTLTASQIASLYRDFLESVRLQHIEGWFTLIG